MNEESFKWSEWVPKNTWAEWSSPKKYDLQDKNKLIIIEAKASDLDLKKIITQGILTSVVEKSLFKIVGAITPNTEMWIDCIENNISIRSLSVFKAIPSKWDSDEWKLAHNLIWGGRGLKTRNKPTQLEYNFWLDAYQFQASKTDADIKSLLSGFIISDEQKKCKNTLWARSLFKDIQKDGAYFTPEHLRLKVYETVSKNWKPTRDTIIWDPFGGDGALLLNFKNNGYTTIWSDLKPQPPINGMNEGLIIDFFNDILTNRIDFISKFKNIIIVTNPPFGKRKVRPFLQWCKDHKIKVATFAEPNNFPFEPMPAIDGFLTLRRKDWANNFKIVTGFFRYIIFPFILFDWDKEPIESLSFFDFYKKDALIDFRLGGSTTNGAYINSTKKWQPYMIAMPDSLYGRIITPAIEKMLISGQRSKRRNPNAFKRK